MQDPKILEDAKNFKFLQTVSTKDPKFLGFTFLSDTKKW